MKFRLETHDDDGNEQVRLYVQGPNGEAILAGIFSPDGTRLDDQRIGEVGDIVDGGRFIDNLKYAGWDIESGDVKELYRIAMLPEPKPKPGLTINDWWWVAISLVVGGAVIAAPYFIR